MKRLGAWFARLRSKKLGDHLPEAAAQVYSQLYGLKNARHFAWCRFGGDKVAYQSIIIDINIENRMLVMDEPFGLPSQFFWSPGLPIHVEIKDYANRIDFKSRFIRLDPEESGNRMLIAWPPEVHSHQRRSVFRVNFAEQDDVPAAASTSRIARSASSTLAIAPSHPETFLPASSVFPQSTSRSESIPRGS